MSDWRIAGGVMDERAERRAAEETSSGWEPDEVYDRDDDRPGPRGPDPYRGTCGGCGQHVSASQEGGSCLWTGGPWHPECRRRDPAWQAKHGGSR